MFMQNLLEKNYTVHVKTPNVPLSLQTWLIYPIIKDKNEIFKALASPLFGIYGKMLSCNKSKKFT